MRSCFVSATTSDSRARLGSALTNSDIGRFDIDVKTLLSHGATSPSVVAALFAHSCAAVVRPAAGKKWYQMVDRQNFKLMAGQIELAAEFKGTGAPKILSKVSLASWLFALSHCCAVLCYAVC